MKCELFGAYCRSFHSSEATINASTTGSRSLAKLSLVLFYLPSAAVYYSTLCKARLTLPDYHTLTNASFETTNLSRRSQIRSSLLLSQHYYRLPKWKLAVSDRDMRKEQLDFALFRGKSLVTDAEKLQPARPSVGRSRPHLLPTIIADYICGCAFTADRRQKLTQRDQDVFYNGRQGAQKSSTPRLH